VFSVLFTALLQAIVRTHGHPATVGRGVSRKRDPDGDVVYTQCDGETRGVYLYR